MKVKKPIVGAALMMAVAQSPVSALEGSTGPRPATPLKAGVSPDKESPRLATCRGSKAPCPTTPTGHQEAVAVKKTTKKVGGGGGSPKDSMQRIVEVERILKSKMLAVKKTTKKVAA
jgi:hypothetical protein